MNMEKIRSIFGMLCLLYFKKKYGQLVNASKTSLKVKTPVWKMFHGWIAMLGLTSIILKHYSE